MELFKKHQVLIAVVVLVLLYLWWKRTPQVTSTFTAGAPVVPKTETQTLGDQATSV